MEEDNWPEGIGEDTKEIIRKYVSALNGGKLESYDDSIKNLLTQGEFNFITKGEQNLSLALDILPLVGDVKGIAESIRGKEFITGRELSDAERAMSGVSSLVGFIPGVGEIGTIAKAGEKLGAKAVVKEAAKYTVKETLQGAGMYGSTSIASELGITPRQQIMAMGGFSLYRGGTAVLKNPMVKSAINNSADIAKATVKDAILADSGRIVLNAGIGGQGKQLYNSFKKVTAERKALREGIASGEYSISRIPENVDNIKLKEVTGNLFNKNELETVEKNKEVSYKRPSGFRKGVRDAVWESAKDENGDVMDPLTGEIMNKSKPWDMGHKPGYEFRKHQKSAKERGVSRKQFLNEHNNPEHYRPELPSSNRSHRGEDLTDSYFGD